MVPSNSMIGRSRSLQASSTWSPTIAAIFSDDNPSDFAISAVLRAAATGLAAPILVTIFIPLAAQAGNTARIRSSSSGSYPPSGFFMRACCASATVRSPRHSNTRYSISPFSASSTAGSMRSPEYPAPDPIRIVRKVSPSSLRANGSRECAPDDTLREAIHAAARRAGLLRRCAPRNDGTLARERAGIQAYKRSDCACTGIRAMQQVGWTVDAPWSNVASRPQQRAPRPDLSGGSDRYGRANARATETDAGNPAFL